MTTTVTELYERSKLKMNEKKNEKKWNEKNLSRYKLIVHLVSYTSDTDNHEQVCINEAF